MGINPYKNLPTIPEGFALVIRRVKEEGPPVYFVKEFRGNETRAIREYWSPLQSLALRFVSAPLALEFTHHLDRNPDAFGVTDLFQVLHRETVRPKTMLNSPHEQQKRNEQAARSGVFRYLTTYSGVNGEKEKPQEIHPKKRKIQAQIQLRNERIPKW